jgi:hypothetical protein
MLWCPIDSDTQKTIQYCPAPLELLNPTFDNHITFLPLIAFLVHQNVNYMGWQNVVVKMLEKQFIITVQGHDFRWGKGSL